MRIGLIDVDKKEIPKFPNLPLMKLSAWHKQQGDQVKWYEHLFDGYPEPPLDRVYMSKVFTPSKDNPDYQYDPNAHEVIKSGTGYFYPDGGPVLPPEIEHIYPDYSLYPELTTNTAYGFLSRGCPRGCDFCIVGEKEGRKSYKVANLSEFWRGQKNIVLLDPNITACPDWEELFQQLIDSGAGVDFTQGLDIRLMTPEKAELLQRVNVEMIHFAWDNYKDKNIIIPKLKEFKDFTGWDIRKMAVYVLVGFNSTLDEDLERIYTIRDLGYWLYVMVYNKDNLPPRHKLKQLQRWVNMRATFQTVRTFEEYKDK